MESADESAGHSDVGSCYVSHCSPARRAPSSLLLPCEREEEEAAFPL